MSDEGNSYELKDFKSLGSMLGIFYSIAISLWLITGSIFYLVNFAIIGTVLGLGIGLWPVLSRKNKHIARKMSQVLVGGYIFFGIGLGLVFILFGFIQLIKKNKHPR